jgi:hypothetical protein
MVTASNSTRRASTLPAERALNTAITPLSGRDASTPRLSSNNPSAVCNAMPV